MTTPDLLKDLEAVALLAEKATPGEWDVFVRRGGMLDVGASHNCTVACTAVPVVGDCEANAHLIVRAVNFLRTHHAEIAEAVRDARGERSESWEVWQGDMPVAGSDSLSDARHYLMMYGQDGPVKLVRKVEYRETVTPEQIAAMRAGEGEG